MSNNDKFTIEDGKLLIRFARENIEYYLKNDDRLPTDPYSMKSKSLETYLFLV